MVLEVPRMDFKGIVQDGTTDEILNLGVGLFPQGQLPGKENRNVCIAGHRDIYGKEFWDIDKITDGDLFYLTYQEKRYTYEYFETMLTEPDDWAAVRVREFPVLTLQSCDPIMVASHRIFKIGKLISIEDVPEEELQGNGAESADSSASSSSPAPQA
jgi:sortase A